VYCILISAPSLRVYYCQHLTLSVCQSVCAFVCHKLQTASSFFRFSMESCHFWPPVLHDPLYKTFSSIFDLGPKKPKIYSAKLHKIAYKSACMADRPEMFVPTRGFSEMTDSMEPCKMLLPFVVRCTRPHWVGCGFGHGSTNSPGSGLVWEIGLGQLFSGLGCVWVDEIETFRNILKQTPSSSKRKEMPAAIINAIKCFKRASSVYHTFDVGLRMSDRA